MNIFDFMNSHPFISLAIAFAILIVVDNIFVNLFRGRRKNCPKGSSCTSCRAEDYPDYKKWLKKQEEKTP